MIRQLNVYRKMKGELYESKKRTALLGRVYLIICLIVALFPIYWMINTSFKSDSEIYAKVPTLIPHHPTGAAYSYLINNTNFSVQYEKQFDYCGICFCIFNFNSIPCCVYIIKVEI